MKQLKIALLMSYAIVCQSWGGDTQDAVAIMTHVMTGDDAPGGNGTFDDFDGVFLSGNGQIVFRAELSNTSKGSDDDSGAFRCLADGTIQEVMREGEDLGSGFFALDFNLMRTRIADDGLIGFQPLVQLGPVYAVFGQPVGGATTAVAFPDVSPQGIQGPILNTQVFDNTLSISNAGLCFEAIVDTPPVESMLLLATPPPSSTVTSILRSGDPSPDGYGVLYEASRASMNDQGQIAIYSSVSDPFELGTNRILIRSDPLLGHQTVARQGDFAPDTDRRFRFFDNNDDSIAVGSSGHVAFRTELLGPASGPEEHGIFLWNGTTVTTVARTGQESPLGGTFDHNLSTRVGLNGNGTVAFIGRLTGAPLSGLNIDAIFRSDGASLTEIVRVGDVVPDNPKLSFTALSGTVLNEQDDLLFFGRLDAPGSPWSLWIEKSNGTMVRLLTWGDTLEVRPGDFRQTTSVGFYWPHSGIEGGSVAFNDQRQVAVFASFSDGSKGIMTLQLIDSCDADVQVDGSVNVADLLALLANWGTCDEPCPPECDADIDGSCSVGVSDLLELLASWGPCSQGLMQ